MKNLARKINKQVISGQKSPNRAITQLESLIGNTSNASSRRSYQRTIVAIKQYVKAQIK